MVVFKFLLEERVKLWIIFWSVADDEFTLHGLNIVHHHVSTIIGFVFQDSLEKVREVEMCKVFFIIFEIFVCDLSKESQPDSCTEAGKFNQLLWYLLQESEPSLLLLVVECRKVKHK